MDDLKKLSKEKLIEKVTIARSIYLTDRQTIESLQAEVQFLKDVVKESEVYLQDMRTTVVSVVSQIDGLIRKVYREEKE